MSVRTFRCRKKKDDARELCANEIVRPWQKVGRRDIGALVEHGEVAHELLEGGDASVGEDLHRKREGGLAASSNVRNDNVDVLLASGDGSGQVTVGGSVGGGVGGGVKVFPELCKS